MNLIEKLKAELAKIEDVFNRWTHHVDPEQALKDSTKSFAVATTEAVSDLHDRVAKLEGKAKPLDITGSIADNKPAEKSEAEKSHTEE